MFLAETENCNFADDITIYEHGANTEDIMEYLEYDALKLIV